MAKLDPQVLRHLEWIGFVQPSGLVVSGPALVRAGAILDRQDIEGQRRGCANASRIGRFDKVTIQSRGCPISRPSRGPF